MFGFGKKSQSLEKKVLLLEAKVQALEESNALLRKALLDFSSEISNIDTILRACVFSQGQLADDVGAIYDAVKKVLEPEDSYTKHMLKFGPDDDPDDGGYLN